jgi:hypothetical protein
MTYWIHKHGFLRAVSILVGISKQNDDTETKSASVTRYTRKDSYTVLVFLERRRSQKLDNSTFEK